MRKDLAEILTRLRQLHERFGLEKAPTHLPEGKRWWALVNAANHIRKQLGSIEEREAVLAELTEPESNGWKLPDTDERETA